MLRGLLLVLAVAACGSQTTTPPPSPGPSPVAAGSGSGGGGSSGSAMARPVGAASPESAVAAQLASGAALYAKYCQLCHGDQAQGYRADFAPSLVSETFLATATDSFLLTGIVEGRPGTAMGAYGDARGGPLTPRDASAILAWVRSLKPGIERVKLPKLPAVGDAARGRALYATNCQSCHGDQTTRVNAVHLANPVFLASASDEFLRHAIVYGRPSTPMLPWAGKLDAQQIDDIIAFVRTWQPPPAKPDPHAGHDHAHAGHNHDDHAGHNHPPPAQLGPLTGPLVVNPNGKPPVFTPRENRFVPAAQVADAIKTKKKMIFIDARTPADYERGHIPGALLVPYYARERLDALKNDGTWVLAYCACPHHASGEIVDELRKRGFPNTAIIDEGIVFWEKQGYPMAKGPAK